jgi:hypothetical protein
LPIRRIEGKTPENDGVMDGENATESADFHTRSEFMEGISEREEDSTDHTTSNNGQEETNVDESDVQENPTMDTIITQIPQNKLEEITG